MVDRVRDGYDNGFDSSFSLKFGDMSWTTNPQVANQLGELGTRLNEGVKNVEIGALSQQIFDAIPKQHFEEMRRVSKLGDVGLSMHAPLTDPAGFSEQNWQEHRRNLAEHEFKDVIERAHMLDPEGNIPVNFHSSGGGIPATIWEKKEEGKPEEKQLIVAVNTKTGELKPLQREKMSWLTSGEKIMTPEDRLRNLNHVSWDEEKLQFMGLRKQKHEVERQQDFWRLNTPEGKALLELEMDVKAKRKLSEEDVQRYAALKQEDKSYEDHKDEIDRHMVTQLNSLYEDYVGRNGEGGYEPRGPDDKRNHKIMTKMLNEYKNKFTEKSRIENEFRKDINKWVQSNPNLSDNDYRKGINERSKKFDAKLEKKGLDIAPEEVGNLISQLQAPERYKWVDDVAKEKAAETFANVAFHGYDKFGKSAPLISVENVFPEWTLSRADSLKGMIELSKKKFVDRLKEEKNLSDSEAKQVAEKNLGVTWDVGHINQLRKYGHTDKDIIEESKKIAKHVKHLHITDNFGHADSHLAPGMGNVPIKEQIAEIQKAGFKGKAVIEGGGMFQNFKTNPIPYTVDRGGMNSPFYSYDTDTRWGDVRDIYSSYMYGFGDMLPDQHFKSQGAGFSLLPKELGGQGSGDQGRFANQNQ